MIEGWEQAFGKGVSDENLDGYHDDVLPVQSCSKTLKSSSAPVMQAMANTKNTPMHGGCDVIKKVLKVIKYRAMSLESCNSKWSHDEPTRSQLRKFDN